MKMETISQPGKVYFTSRQVRQRYGGCSDMTLWRWQNDPSLDFPAPEKINSRRYWCEEHLDAWDRERALRNGRAA